MKDLALVYGPLLIGGAVALMLSGIVAVQCIIFFKLYPDESGVKTGMVATVWTLDVAQSAFIAASLFSYFVTHFGDTTIVALIPGSVALTILLTAAQTCVVHLFYAHKIHRSSGKNWFITFPIVFLASLRLLAAILSTVEMLRLGHWKAFQDRPYPRFLFTSGLSLSAGTDMIITICLCYYLRRIRKLSSSSVMRNVLDTLTLYTLENGLITCLATMGSLFFWLFYTGTSFSLSLHFIIGKLYPNSLLLLLNTRKELREMHSGDPGVQILDTSKHLAASYYTSFPHRSPPPPPISHRITQFPLSATPSHDIFEYRPSFKMHHPQPQERVQVKVQRTVTRDSDYIPASLATSDLEAQSEPGSLGNTSLKWRALP
ncbi:glycoside hydrolase [Favolaschia claudopus]|uniref:Glycoside hydrolase n=1 Tax=Favolaschia claudopus TaxID=2862362 RepID=A0AAW0CM02_9AGAR